MTATHFIDANNKQFTHEDMGLHMDISGAYWLDRFVIDGRTCLVETTSAYDRDARFANVAIQAKAMGLDLSYILEVAEV